MSSSEQSPGEKSFHENESLAVATAMDDTNNNKKKSVMSTSTMKGDPQSEERTKKEKEDEITDNILHVHLEEYEFDKAYTVISNEGNPDLCKSYGILGEYPMHMALKRGAPENLILLILDKWPQVCFHHGLYDKSLPLHLAALHACSPRIILNLISIYPEALDQRDEDGDTPRQCLRKDLDSFAKDSLTKPTFYWTDLIKRIKSDDHDHDVAVGKEKDEDLQDEENLDEVESKLSTIISESEQSIRVLSKKLKKQKDRFLRKETDYQHEIERLKKRVSYLIHALVDKLRAQKEEFHKKELRYQSEIDRLRSYVYQMQQKERRGSNSSSMSWSSNRSNRSNRTSASASASASGNGQAQGQGGGSTRRFSLHQQQSTSSRNSLPAGRQTREQVKDLVEIDTLSETQAEI